VVAPWHCVSIFSDVLADGAVGGCVMTIVVQLFVVFFGGAVCPALQFVRHCKYKFANRGAIWYPMVLEPRQRRPIAS
jgi:hypothetical protein